MTEIWIHILFTELSKYDKLFFIFHFLGGVDGSLSILFIVITIKNFFMEYKNCIL